MMKLTTTLLLIITSLAFNSARADSAIDNLITCLSDSTSGKDRKDLAIWIFTSMSAHPEIASISNISPEVINKTEARVGEIYNRLLTESCKAQIDLVATNLNNPKGLEIAFEHLGRLAMQEIISNKEVSNALMGPVKYIEIDKLKQQ